MVPHRHGEYRNTKKVSALHNVKVSLWKCIIIDFCFCRDEAEHNIPIPQVSMRLKNCIIQDEVEQSFR